MRIRITMEANVSDIPSCHDAPHFRIVHDVVRSILSATQEKVLWEMERKPSKDEDPRLRQDGIKACKEDLRLAKRLITSIQVEECS